MPAALLRVLRHCVHAGCVGIKVVCAHVYTQILRCQYVYLCTSKASKLCVPYTSNASVPGPFVISSSCTRSSSGVRFGTFVRVSTYFCAGKARAHLHLLDAVGCVVADNDRCVLAYVSIRQHTSAYVSKRQHMSAYVSVCLLVCLR
jgi:hypothetical protein